MNYFLKWKATSHIKVTNDWRHSHTLSALSPEGLYLYGYPVSVIQGRGKNSLIDGKSKSFYHLKMQNDHSN